MKYFVTVPLTLKQANEFVEKYHRHNKKVTGHKFSIGLKVNAELIGVAIAGRPIARLLDDGETLEVLRVCIKPTNIINANSFLYGKVTRIAKLMGYKKIITYTLEKESQSSMKAVGARIVAKVKPQEWSRVNRERK